MDDESTSRRAITLQPTDALTEEKNRMSELLRGIWIKHYAMVNAGITPENGAEMLHKMLRDIWIKRYEIVNMNITPEDCT